MDFRKFGIWSVALAIGLGASTIARSSPGDEGWSLPNLNPFAAKPKTSKSTKSAPSRKISESKSSGWLWNPFASSGGTTKTSSSRRPSEPNGLTKTWEAITPWEERPATKPVPLTGLRSRSKPGAKKPEEKGWFESLFGPEEPPPKPKTVNEFLDLERPEF